MPEYFVFPSDGSRTAYAPSGLYLSHRIGAQVRFWNDKALTQAASLFVMNPDGSRGAAIANSTVTVNAVSQFPLFFAQDTDTLWYNAGPQGAQPVYARVDDRVDALETLAEGHVTDTTSAHDAASVALVSALLSATNVKAGVEEAFTRPMQDLAGHRTALNAAHGAQSVSLALVPGLTATNVQAGIEEVWTETGSLDSRLGLLGDDVLALQPRVGRVTFGTLGARPSAATFGVGLYFGYTTTLADGTLYHSDATAWRTLAPPADTSPNTELGYAQITSTYTATTGASVVAVPGLSITVTVGTRPIELRFEGYLQNSGANASGVSLWEGATELTECLWPVAATAHRETCSVRLAPAPGSHTYVAKFNSGSATLAGSIVAAPVYPAYITARSV